MFEAHAVWQDDAKAIEECGLCGVWLGDAAQTNRAVHCGRQDHVVRLNVCQFFEDGTRRVSETGTLLPHLKAFPQHVSKEANEDVSLNPVLALVPNGTDVQLIFADPESGFDLGASCKTIGAHAGISCQDNNSR